jgi:hypothetical protein
VPQTQMFGLKISGQFAAHKAKLTYKYFFNTELSTVLCVVAQKIAHESANVLNSWPTLIEDYITFLFVNKKWINYFQIFMVLAFWG